MIYIILAFLIFFAFFRCVSFSVYQVKEKNYSGAVFLFLLTVFSTVSSILNLMT